MIHALLLCLLFSFPLTSALSHAATDPIYPPDIQKIKARGKLIVTQYQGERKGFFMYDHANEFPDYPGYSDNQGRLVGYDIEIAGKIAERLGVDLEIQRKEKSFTNLCTAVSHDEADLAISKLTVTMERAQYVSFSKPYAIFRLGLLINRLKEETLPAHRKKDIFTLLNHKDAKIAVQKGTSWIAFGQDLFPKGKLVEYPSMETAFDAAIKGEALACLNDEWNIASELRSKPEIAVRTRLAFVPDFITAVAIAVSPGSPHLLSYVNTVIERDGMQTTPDALLKKYFSEGSALQIASAIVLAEQENGKKTGTPFLPTLLTAAVTFFFIGIWLYFASSGRRRKSCPDSSHENEGGSNEKR
jgi:polar amino acid transport system substrate-binding protein